jgi:hypothetical protein
MRTLQTRMFIRIFGKAPGCLASCAGYLEHPFKKKTHGDERSGYPLLADFLITEGKSGRIAHARYLYNSISSAKKEMKESGNFTQGSARFAVKDWNVH